MKLYAAVNLLDERNGTTWKKGCWRASIAVGLLDGSHEQSDCTHRNGRRSINQMKNPKSLAALFKHLTGRDQIVSTAI